MALQAKDPKELFASMCAGHGMHPQVLNLLQQNGYTTASVFAHALARDDLLEQFLEAVFVKAGLMQAIAPQFVLPWSSHPEVAKVRKLWTDCWQSCSQKSSANSTAQASTGAWPY